ISACWRSVCLFRKNQLYRIASMFALGLCQSFKFILDSSDLLQTNIRFFPTLFDFYRDWNVELKEFMEDHFTENLSLSEFASYSGRSLATFKRDFLKITELSPAKWLMTRRLDLAENLLKENKLSIKQISYSVGFKTPAHFSTAFKKRHEMTPSEYRASNTGCN
uniref:helix-turn-helix domain-containing protein n=1 Tax=Parasutterella excrementihominis TaxID=487175 RepID=UPI003AAA20CD